MFYDKFVRLCHENGKSMREVMRGAGLAETAYSRWRRGGEPLLETKMKLADYFGVTVDELDGAERTDTANDAPASCPHDNGGVDGGITVFSHKDFGDIRTVEIDGEPWFVGKDVAEALGYSDVNKAVAMHVESEDKLNDKTASSLGQRGGWLINESGLYSLVMSSKLPGARQFKHWVTSEVLPTIRKHGAYLTPQKIEDALLNPDVIINLALQLKAEKQKNAELTAKAAYYDAVAGASGSTNFRDTAKMLGISEKKFIETVLGEKYCYRAVDKKIVPYSQYMVAGWFEVREVYYGSPDAPHCTIQTRITPYGRENIYIRFKRKGIL